MPGGTCRTCVEECCLTRKLMNWKKEEKIEEKRRRRRRRRKKKEKEWANREHTNNIT